MMTQNDVLCQVDMAIGSFNDLNYHRLLLQMVLEFLEKTDDLTFDRIHLLVSLYLQNTDADLDSVQYNLDRIKSHLLLSLTEG